MTTEEVEEQIKGDEKRGTSFENIVNFSAPFTREDLYALVPAMDTVGKATSSSTNKNPVQSFVGNSQAAFTSTTHVKADLLGKRAKEPWELDQEIQVRSSFEWEGTKDGRELDKVKMKLRAVADSGCNIHIVNPELVRKHKLTPMTFKTPITIEFGQGDKAVATHYVNLGYLGRAAIVDSPSSLISISALTMQGPLEAVFTSYGFKLLDRGATTPKTLFKTRKTADDLYVIDIDALMKMAPPTHHEHYADMRRLQSNKDTLEGWIRDQSKEDDVDDEDVDITNNIDDRSVLSALELTSDDEETDEDIEDREIQQAVDTQPKKKRRRSTRLSRGKFSAIMWLHKCLGHIGTEPLAVAVDKKLWSGIPVGITGNDVRKVFNHLPCTACQLSKRNAATKRVGSGVISPYAGEELSIDYQGTICPPSSTGYTGFFLVEDVGTGYLHAKMTKSKDADSLIEFLQTKVLPFYRQHGNTVKRVRCDRGSTETSTAVDRYLKSCTPIISLQPAGVQAQNQNPVERTVQTLIKGVGAVLIDQYTLSSRRWDLAVEYWIDRHNATPNSKCDDGQSCPYTEVTGLVPDVEKQFAIPFGCPVTVNDPEGKQSKFDIRNKYGIAVGHSSNGNGDTKVIIPSIGITNGHRPLEVQEALPLKLAHKVLTEVQKRNLQPRFDDVTDTVRFFSPTNDEPSNPRTQPMEGSTIGFDMYDIPNKMPSDPIESSELSTPIHSGTDEILTTNTVPSDFAIRNRPRRSTGTYHDVSVGETNESTGSTDPPDNLTATDINVNVCSDQNSCVNLDLANIEEERVWKNMSYSASMWCGMDNHQEIFTQRSSTNPLDNCSKRFTENVLRNTCPATDVYAAFKAQKAHTPLNPTLHQAKKCSEDEWYQWQKAILTELAILQRKGCYQIVRRQDIPADAQIFNSKLDLRVKKNTTGEYIKHKARLVVLGNEEPFEDRDNYAPTCNQKALSILLALSSQHDMTLSGLDIKAAFISADIDGDVYMRLPKGLTDDPEEPPTYWKLKKSLYGLRRSPKLFNEDLAKHLRQGGYIQSPYDRCLFHKREGDKLLAFVIYVDDFAICSQCDKMTLDLKTYIKTKYEEVEETETLEHYVGTHIHYDYENGERYLNLSQPAHLQKCFDHFGITDENVKYHPNTPMATMFELENLLFSYEESPQTSSRCDSTLYRSGLGILIYCLRSRPEVAFSINTLACRSTTCTEDDYQALKRVALYLHKTREKTLRYKCSSKSQAAALTKLHAWSDASFANLRGSKSQTGTCFSLSENGPMFYWKSKAQPVVSLSTLQSELNASVDATQDIAWFRGILEELGFPQYHPTPLYTDSKSLVALATNYSGNHKRVRHFVTKVNFMVQQVQDAMIDLIHIAGEEMPADIFTKALASDRHEKLTTHITRGKPASVATALAATAIPHPYTINCTTAGINSPTVSHILKSAMKHSRPSIYEHPIHNTLDTTTKRNKLFPRRNMITYATFYYDDPPIHIHSHTDNKYNI